ncbi:hypothetical protein KSP39_PZI010210 [Platanthera zijinensis]|uniref:FAF domain-containing protein n=1 Tax=Platanthera zijinensis TaxID=2320716 RepID=A0AAP0BJJ5_9ASPA
MKKPAGEVPAPSRSVAIFSLASQDRSDKGSTSFATSYPFYRHRRVVVNELGEKHEESEQKRLLKEDAEERVELSQPQAGHLPPSSPAVHLLSFNSSEKMSVEVCRIALLHPVLPEIETEEGDEQKQMLDIWSSIQKNNENITVAPPSSLYVHPLVRQASSLMSQNSLEICTESLGSETGSYEFSGDELMDSPFGDETEDEEEEVEEEEECQEMERNDLSNVKYHCSIGRRSPARSFPPPLPSISRRDGFCFKMQPHRHNGRLVLESVPVPSHNYLRAERHGGRLLLSFIETAGQSNSPAPTELQSEKQNEEEEEVLRETEEEDVLMEAEEEEDEEEEEVEVVDRGTIVEVKVSTQPPPANRAGMLKVHRSSLVINKFIVGSPLPAQASPHMKGKRTVLSTTTAASNNMSPPNKDNSLQQQQGSRWVPLSPAAAASSESKLLFTSKRRSRDELLHDVRRCSELRRLLFIFEQPYCIATS